MHSRVAAVGAAIRDGRRRWVGVRSEGVASRGLWVLSAVAALLAANVYLAQVLASQMVTELDLPVAAAGLLPMVAQAGYALGLLALVPLGDRVSSRPLLRGACALAAVGALSVAASPAGWVAGAGLFLLGLGSSAAQTMVPLLSRVSDPAERGGSGGATGVVVAGLLVGVVLARPLAVWGSASSSWRVVFLAALLGVALVAVLAHRLPVWVPPSPPPLAVLVRRSAHHLRRDRLLHRRIASQGALFAALTVFWTALAVQLPRAGAPHAVGVVSFAGLAAVLAAPVAGRLVDRGLGRVTTGLALSVAAAVMITCALLPVGASGLPALVVAAALLELCVGLAFVTSQHALLAGAGAGRRGTVMAVFSSSYYLLGAAAGATAPLLLELVGWPATLSVWSLPLLAALAYGVVVGRSGGTVNGQGRVHGADQP